MSSQDTISLSSSWEAVTAQGYDRELAEARLKKVREMEQRRQRELQDEERARQEKAENDEDGALMFADAIIEDIVYSAKFRAEFEAFSRDFDDSQEIIGDIIDERLQKERQKLEQLEEQKQNMESETLYLASYNIYVFADKDGDYFDQEGNRLDEEQDRAVAEALAKDPDQKLASKELYQGVKIQRDAVEQSENHYKALKQKHEEIGVQRRDLQERIDRGEISEEDARIKMAELKDAQQNIISDMTPEDRMLFVKDKQERNAAEREELEKDYRNGNVSQEEFEKESEFLQQSGDEAASLIREEDQAAFEDVQQKGMENEVSTEALGGAYDSIDYGSFDDSAYDAYSSADYETSDPYAGLDSGAIKSSVDLKAAFTAAHDNKAAEPAVPQTDTGPTIYQERGPILPTGPMG